MSIAICNSSNHTRVKIKVKMTFLFFFLQCRALKSVIEMQRVYVKFHNNRVTIHMAMLALSIMNRSLAIKVQNVYAKSQFLQLIEKCLHSKKPMYGL